MGVFRFLLAALVVLFHFGGLSWIVGRVAVYAFYCSRSAGLVFNPPLIPQGWSIGVEISCYLLVPLVVMTTARRPRWTRGSPPQHS